MFPLELLLLLFSQVSGIFRLTVCEPMHIFTCVVFIPVIYGWESTHSLISDGPYYRKQAYPLKTGRGLNGTGGKSLIGDWLPLFLETILLVREC